MMGLDFKIDVILNGNAKVCKLFCGDFKKKLKQLEFMQGNITKQSLFPIVIS